MRIIFSDYEKDQFKRYAKEVGCSVKELQDVFVETHNYNFNQDLWDTIELNRDTLGRD